MIEAQIQSIASLLPSLYKAVSQEGKLTKHLFFAAQLQVRLIRHILQSKGNNADFLKSASNLRKSLQENPFVRRFGIIWLVYSDTHLHMWTPYNETFISWLKSSTPPSARAYQTSDKSWTLHLDALNTDAMASQLSKHYKDVCCVVVDVRDSDKQDIPRVCFL